MPYSDDPRGHAVGSYSFRTNRVSWYEDDDEHMRRLPSRSFDHLFDLEAQGSAPPRPDVAFVYYRADKLTTCPNIPIPPPDGDVFHMRKRRRV